MNDQWPGRAMTDEDKAREKIGRVIRQVVREFDEHPYDINNGNCVVFGTRVCKRVPGAVCLQGDDCLEALPEHIYEADAHAFIFYKGLYFDAEEPVGVISPAMLPFYQRQAHSPAEKIA